MAIHKLALPLAGVQAGGVCITMACILLMMGPGPVSKAAVDQGEQASIACGHLMLIEGVSALFPGVSALLRMLPAQAGQEAMTADISVDSCVGMLGLSCRAGLFCSCLQVS